MELHFKLAGLNLAQIVEDGDIVDHKGDHLLPRNDVTESPCNDETLCYRFASDPSLPWRLHASLRWALFSCLQQFGDHLRTIQMDVKRKRKLEQLWKTLM